MAWPPFSAARRTRNSFPTLPRRFRSAHCYLELVGVVLLMGIAAKVAVPRYAGAMQHFHIQAAAKRVVADVEFARQNARTMGMPRQVTFTLGTSTYTLPGIEDPAHSGLPYAVNLTAGRSPAELAQVRFGSSGNGHTLVFDMYGRPDYPGSLVLRVGTSQKTIRVDRAGRATVQ